MSYLYSDGSGMNFITYGTQLNTYIKGMFGNVIINSQIGGDIYLGTNTFTAGSGNNYGNTTNDVYFGGNIFMQSQTPSGPFTSGPLSVSSYGLIYTSDNRTKTEINTINSSDSLDILRKIQPIKFKFIDTTQNTTEYNYGFIAQDIKEVVPDSIFITSGYIPNIYDNAELINKNTIKLSTKPTNNFIKDSLKIKILIDEHNLKKKEKKVTIKKIIDENTFIINEDIENLDSQNIFVYGQEINDYHKINYSNIFTMSVSSIKQLDNELQETKQIVQNQQKDIDNLKNEIENLKELIAKICK